MSKRGYTRHGMRHLSEYDVWAGMLQRCTVPDSVSYPRYGGRGITVCSKWIKSFVDFYAYVGPRPSMGHTLERIDNSIGYQPGNVKWATRKQQSRNTRTNRRLTLNGVTKSVVEWSEALGISQDNIHSRLKRGWTHEDCLTVPIGNYKFKGQTSAGN